MAHPLRVVEALILGGYETGNSSEMFHVVTADFGRLSIYAKGVLGPRGKFRGLLQPLNTLELGLVLREGSEVGTLRDASVLVDRSHFASDLERMALGMLLGEAAAASCEPLIPAPEVYEVLMQGLALLEPTGTERPLVAACVTLLRLLEVGGYEIRLADEVTAAWPIDKPKPTCFWLDVETSTIQLPRRVEARPPDWEGPVPDRAPQIPIPPAALRYVYTFVSGKAPALLDATAARWLLAGLVRLVEMHGHSNLRSMEFLRKMQGDR